VEGSSHGLISGTTPIFAWKDTETYEHSVSAISTSRYEYTAT